MQQDNQVPQPTLDGHVDHHQPGPLEVRVYVSEMWTAVYANGALVTQGSRIGHASWLQLLRRTGATCEEVRVSTAAPPSASDEGSRLEFSVSLPSGDWPEEEQALRELIGRRQKGAAVVQELKDQLRQAEYDFNQKKRDIKQQLEHLGLTLN
jgi:hypothetical protein